MNWELNATVRCHVQQNKILFLIRVAVPPGQPGRPAAALDPPGLCCHGGVRCRWRWKPARRCCARCCVRMCAFSHSLSCTVCVLLTAQVLTRGSKAMTLCTISSRTLWCTKWRRWGKGWLFGSDFAASPLKNPLHSTDETFPLTECLEKKKQVS